MLSLLPSPFAFSTAGAMASCPKLPVRPEWPFRLLVNFIQLPWNMNQQVLITNGILDSFDWVI